MNETEAPFRLSPPPAIGYLSPLKPPHGSRGCCDQTTLRSG